MLLLKLFDLNSGVNDVSHGPLHLSSLRVEILSRHVLRSLDLSCLLLPVHENLEILVELFGILEALEDVMPIHEALGPAINGILEAKLMLLCLEA